jgi:hypothetical protein
MKETHKVKYSDPLEIGFPDNWEIFKMDTTVLCDRQYDHTPNNILNKVVNNSIKWKNNLFGHIGLTFKNNKASAIEASVKRFESDQERSIWLKKNRPLIYCIFDQRTPLCDMETFEPVEPVTIQHTYFVRYFSHAGKLSWLKYKLQFLIGKYNFKCIRPFLYRYLVMD